MTLYERVIIITIKLAENNTNNVSKLKAGVISDV